MSDLSPKAIIERVVARAPEWLRHDLAAKDKSARNRAEESLAAMIAEALAEDHAGDAAG